MAWLYPQVPTESIQPCVDPVGLRQIEKNPPSHKFENLESHEIRHGVPSYRPRSGKVGR